MSIDERVKTARAKLKMSQAQLAAAITRLGVKTGQSTIGNLEAGKIQKPRFLPELAEALGVTVEWLRHGTETKLAQVPVGARSVRIADVVVPTVDSMPRDVPVLGTATGGNGQVLMRGEAIDYVRRPPSLAGRNDVFALYVEDVSMSPAFNPGDLVFIEKRRPRVGDHAVVEYQDAAHEDVKVIIKRLAAVTATAMKFEQYNPQKIIEIKTQAIVRVQRVMTMADLFVI